MTKCHDEKNLKEANKDVEKQKADAEADVILFEISGANGLVCRCRFPAVVAQHGLFRILLGFMSRIPISALAVPITDTIQIPGQPSEDVKPVYRSIHTAARMSEQIIYDNPVEALASIKVPSTGPYPSLYLLVSILGCSAH